MADIRFTCSEASLLLEKLSNSCREWSLADLKCIEDELSHTLSDVRMSVNAQRPVNRLPVEILSKIFHQVPPSLTPRVAYGCSLKYYLVWDSFFDFKDTDALLPLTHVCRWWRDVALGTPTLWTTLYGSSHPDAIGEYRLRSQGAPLKVLNIKNKNLDVQQLWRTDGQRIQSLASYKGRNFDLPTSHAHGLHALAAKNCLLQGDVSNLKALVLRAVDWHLPSTLINLTHLYLVKKRLRVVDMLRILSIAPKLEDLSLHKMSAEEAFDAHEDIPAVTLQHLHRLVIHRPDRKLISGFFSHVGVPASLAINLEDCEASDFQWLVPLTQNDAKSLYISAYTYSVIVTGPSKAVRFSSKLGSDPMDQWIAALLSHFQLKELWIASTYGSGELEEEIIKHTPWAETLHLDSFACMTMIGALLKYPTWWPKLTKVVLSHPCQPIEILKLAESRARLGCPLEELECHESRSMISEMFSLDLEKIKSYVGVVRLIEDGPIALPLPDVCTDGVPSPHFWPKEWSAMPNHFLP